MGEFMIEAARAEKLCQASGLGMEEFLASLVQPTADLARPPISNFRVGAVGLGASGRIFRGVNLEFPELPFNNSVHAEQFLVANALQHGEKKLVFIAVSAAPCGHCRQFLQELTGAGDIRVLITDGKDANPQPLSYFLPHPFGPDDFLSKDVRLLLEPLSNGLTPSESSSLLRGKNCSKGHFSENAHGETKETDIVEEPEAQANEPSLSKVLSLKSWISTGKNSLTALHKSALDAANASYAPYSGCPSGVSLQTKRGETFSGSYMESAAHNPGLPPLQAAIVAFVRSGGGSYDEIETAVLAEMKGAVVQYAATVHLALKKIAPRSSLYLLEVNGRKN